MKKFFIFFSVFSILTNGIFSQTGKSLTLDEVISLAIENNVSIKREQISLEAAQRASAHSCNSLLPSLSVSVNEEVEFPDLSGNVNTGIQNNLGAEGKIVVSLSSVFFASMQKAKLDYEAKKISFDEAVTEITSQVKETYFSLILAKQNLNFLNENLENEKAQALQNEERYRHGTISEMEYLSSKVSYEKLKPELKSQELAYKSNIKNFCLFLGLDNDELKLEGSLEAFITQYAAYFSDEKKASISDAVKTGNVPSVLNLKKQLEAAQKDVSVARLSAYGPSANLSYSVNPVITGTNKGRIKHSASIGISVPLENLLPFSKGADSVKNAQDSVKDLQLQLEEKSKAVTAEYQHIINSLSQKEESITSLKEYVRLAQANYEATKYSYSKGMTEFLSMQNAAKENLEAKLNLQNDYLDNLKLYISLEKLYGGQ